MLDEVPWCLSSFAYLYDKYFSLNNEGFVLAHSLRVTHQGSKKQEQRQQATLCLQSGSREINADIELTFPISSFCQALNPSPRSNTTHILGLIFPLQFSLPGNILIIRPKVRLLSDSKPSEVDKED